MLGLDPTLQAWAVFVTGVLIVFFIDGTLLRRVSCGVSFYVREIFLWVAATIAFSAFVQIHFASSRARDSFLYGYFLEYMLSIDNLFVYQMIFKAYGVLQAPQSLQQVDKALFWGIGFACLLRFFGFLVGGAILHTGIIAQLFFGLMLVYSGVQTLRSDDEDETDPRQNPFMRCITRFLPVYQGFDKEPRFFIHTDKTSDQPDYPEASGVSMIHLNPDARAVQLEESGPKEAPSSSSHEVVRRRWKVTSLFLAVVSLSVLDVVFALDSMTAKMSALAGLHNPSLEFLLNVTSSACAMFVLRSLYSIIETLSKMFRFLGTGVGIVLIFIGVKLMILNWKWLNDTIPDDVQMYGSFGVIVATLMIAVILSAIFPKAEGEKGDSALEQGRQDLGQELRSDGTQGELS